MGRLLDMQTIFDALQGCGELVVPRAAALEGADGGERREHYQRLFGTVKPDVIDYLAAITCKRYWARVIGLVCVRGGFQCGN